MLRPVALQDPEADRLLTGMPDEQRMASWHLAEPDGTVRSAGAAFPPLLDRLPGARPLGILARRLPAPTERGYQLIAGNRTPIGRRLTEGMKRRADARIAKRERGS